MRLEPVMTMSMGQTLGQFRAAPVSLGRGETPAVAAVYAADFDVDPYVGMFYFPSDTPKLTVFTVKGERLWTRNLGRGVVPGMWFLPMLPFDVDGDGVDEIWFVGNRDEKHPLNLATYVLERVDSRTGRTTGQWPWPNFGELGYMSHTFRFFLLGADLPGGRVLVTAQGTYGPPIGLQGWNADMSRRWVTVIPEGAPGSRGSHMCAISAFAPDGVPEVMWGERCIRLSDGKEMWCADRDSWQGHSDVAQPVLDRETGRMFLYTCREANDRTGGPRVALYDREGRRVWGALDAGHMDMGWTAHAGPGGSLVSVAMRISTKTCGPDGRHHQDIEEFAFDTLTGRPLDLGFKAYRTLPVDLDGDGRHELVRGIPGSDGEVLDGNGRVLGSLGPGVTAMLSQFAGLPGEQALHYAEDGTVRIWADLDAADSAAARARYAHPLYAANRRLTASGSNIIALGGV